jgi:DNA-binding transcriptional ArsR family regulator
MLAAMTDHDPSPIDEEPATPRETLEDLLKRSKRHRIPIRRTFLQRGEGRRSRPGPLAAFVNPPRSRALDLYLLLHAGAAAAPWDVTQSAMSWARMLDMPSTRSSETSISRTWNWLEDQRLVRTKRDGRIRSVYLLLEDGSKRPYSRPVRGQPFTPRGYFKVPYDYFLDDWHHRLKLPAKATLMICLAQKPIFTLPTEPAAGWYGISADTLQRGLDQLFKAGLLHRWQRSKKAPRARHGLTKINHYRLLDPFEVPLSAREIERMAADACNVVPIKKGGAAA